MPGHTVIIMIMYIPSDKQADVQPVCWVQHQHNKPVCWCRNTNTPPLSYPLIMTCKEYSSLVWSVGGELLAIVGKQ